MQAYTGFADIYDALMDDFDHAAWANYYLAILERARVEPRRVFEACCGTGSMSVELAKRGIALTATDISAPMLAHAMEKARREGVSVMFAQMDMCDISVPRPVDAVICACDGVNYLTSVSRVKAFFKSAYAALSEGGVLAFDISSRHKLENMANAFYGEERDDIAYLWENSYAKETRIITMDITFFVRRSDGLYERFSETHYQRAHSQAEIENALNECGFEGVRVYGGMTLDAPSPAADRLHFTAARRGK